MDVRRLGLIDYQAGLDLQQALVEQRKRGEIPDQLLLQREARVVLHAAQTTNVELAAHGRCYSHDSSKLCSRSFSA